MENVPPPEQPATSPPEGPPVARTVGAQLRMAREAAGLSRSDIASRTKVAERHLIAIEDDRLGDLAARTYAVGFARAYARAVGLDEGQVATRVRRQLDADGSDRPTTLPSFEPGDPARVPTRRLAWIAGLGVVAVIVALLVFWSSYLSPEGALPSLLPGQAAAPAAAPSVAAPSSTPAPGSSQGPVMLTATGDHVWIKVTDQTGAQVVQKELALGESWTVPDGVPGPTLRIGRPDALSITVGTTAIPPLATRPQTIDGISLAPADLLARVKPAASSAGSAPAGEIRPAPIDRGARPPTVEPQASPPDLPGAPTADLPGASQPLPGTAASPLSTDSN